MKTSFYFCKDRQGSSTAGLAGREMEGGGFKIGFEEQELVEMPTLMLVTDRRSYCVLPLLNRPCRVSAIGALHPGLDKYKE